jgi:hypothetical protein
MKTRSTFLGILCAFVLAGCSVHHRGDLGEDCNPDGTCNAPALTCGARITNECGIDQRRPRDPRCNYESECFCATCAERCGEVGVDRCEYSDTSVWGAKPAVCKCK